MRLLDAFCYWMTVAIVLLRFAITPRLENIPTMTGTYEAFAHIFVGFLFGVWVCDQTKRPYLIAGIVISAVELFMFIIQKLAA